MDPPRRDHHRYRPARHRRTGNGRQPRDDWTARYLGDDGEPLERAPGPPPEHEMVEFEELEAGGERAVLVNVYAEGQMTLLEVRIRIWACCCTCHDGQDEAQTYACTGDCHDADPT